MEIKDATRSRSRRGRCNPQHVLKGTHQPQIRFLYPPQVDFFIYCIRLEVTIASEVLPCSISLVSRDAQLKQTMKVLY